MIVFGAIFQTIAYAVQAAAPPFPVFILFSFLNGIGMSLQVRTSLWVCESDVSAY